MGMKIIVSINFSIDFFTFFYFLIILFSAINLLIFILIITTLYLFLSFSIFLKESNRTIMEIFASTQQKQTKFFKMHGTGNDFIIINGQKFNKQILSKQEAKQIGAQICHRKFGIGADGLLMIKEIQGVYKMEVINSDGSLPNMCGNGLRCFVALLHYLKLIPNQYKVLTDDGQKNVSIETIQKHKFLVTLKIGKGKQIQEFNHERFGILYLTTIGVPHLVVFLTKEQFDSAFDFQVQGRQLQKVYDANINFCKIQDNGDLTIKTYERGAGLTYSCGTGVSSSIYVGIQKKKVKDNKVKAITDGGQIWIQVTNQKQVIMKGPAQIICQGTYYLK